MNKDTQAYNDKQAAADREVCNILAEEINRHLPQAENKIWHAIPVWFIDGNPIVGYGKLKNCVRLLFWSGQSFEEEDLQKEGSFKAAEARYTAAEQIDVKALKRWLKKSAAIQWDYKNLIKRKGVLERLKGAAPVCISIQNPHYFFFIFLNSAIEIIFILFTCFRLSRAFSRVTR